ncbi:hypothetical protein QUB70_33010 [Microcoleus sp. A003_D6]
MPVPKQVIENGARYQFYQLSQSIIEFDTPRAIATGILKTFRS